MRKFVESCFLQVCSHQMWCHEMANYKNKVQWCGATNRLSCGGSHIPLYHNVVFMRGWAAPISLLVHELAAPGTTLCHGTQPDRETLHVHGGSSRAESPTEFPMTVHFGRAWKHDGSWRWRHNTHFKTDQGKMVHWSAAFSLPCFTLHISFFVEPLVLSKTVDGLLLVCSYSTSHINYSLKEFYWRERWRQALSSTIWLGFCVRGLRRNGTNFSFLMCFCFLLDSNK